MITGSPSVTYESSFGMGVVSIDASWVEIGDVNNSSDMYSAGFIEEV